MLDILMLDIKIKINYSSYLFLKNFIILIQYKVL